MLKLIDYIRLRRAGFSVRLSWRAARNFTAWDKLLAFVWSAFLIYALLNFMFAVNYALIHNSDNMLVRTRLSFHALQYDNAKLENGVIALLNGQPVKLVDSYYVFNKKLDDRIP